MTPDRPLPSTVPFDVREQATPASQTPAEAGAEPDDSLLNRQVGPYRITRKLGSGGMGSVYKARRTDDYQQEVALKVIKHGLDGEEALQRFFRERQVLAGLEHPNIARLLDGGTTADGLPYFVMELIDGQPLGRYCESKQLTTPERARLVHTLCGAVHHAHQRQVIHRDLKPANVLVTADGTPKVTDFGLAKQLGGGEGQTATGAVIGTPGYMAPEQAGAKADAVGPATDVYALGAILYELLTGRPPFKADNPLDVVLQVLSEEPVPPTRLLPKCPRDLETICLKCLQKDPGRRYPTAEALGDDLARFLAGEPIRARPVGRAERAWRWCRRNPKVAVLLALLLVTLVGGFSAVTALWLLAERRGEDLQLKTVEAQKERDRAEKNLDRFFQAVEESLVRVSNSKELKAEEMLAFRRRLLEGAQKQYQQFVAELGDNPRAHDQLARAHMLLLQIHREVGAPAEAVKEGERAIELLRQLVASKPESAHYRSRLALALEYLSSATPDASVSDRALEESLRLREGLLAEARKRGSADEVNRYLSQLAFSYFNKATRTSPRKLEEALDWVTKARTIREAEIQEKRSGPANLEHLAVTCLLMRQFQTQLGRHAEAIASCRRAVDVLRGMERDNPEEGRYAIELARAFNELHMAHVAAGQRKAATAALLQACEVLKKEVTRDVPRGANIFAYQHALAKAWYNLAIHYQEDHPRYSKEARHAFQQTRDLCERLLLVKPSHAELHYWRGVSCHNLVELGRLLLTPEESFRLTQQEVESIKQAVRLKPGMLDWHAELGQALQSVGVQLAARGKPAQGVELLKQAVEHQRKAYDAVKGARYGPELALRYEALARVLRELKRPAEAAAATCERAKLCGGQGLALFQAGRDLALCMALVAEGMTPLSAEQQAERKRYADLAMEQLRAAVAAGYRNVQRYRSDPDLDPLRQREDFQALLRELEKK